MDNDALPAVQFSATSYSVDEDGGTVTILVTLNAAYAEAISVRYATSNGTATAGSDYTAASGTLIFSPGVTTRSFTIAVQQDDLEEENETLVVTLSDPINATIGPVSKATVTITDIEGKSYIYLPMIIK